MNYSSNRLGSWRVLALAATLALPSLPLAAAPPVTKGPHAPKGELTLDRKMVRTGVRTKVDWKVTPPIEEADLITLENGTRIRAKRQKLAVTVRALGSSFAMRKGKSNNGHGNNIDGVDVSNPGKGSGGPNGEIDRSGPVDDEKHHRKGTAEAVSPAHVGLWARTGPLNPWKLASYGLLDDLRPDEVIFEGTVASGDAFDLSARLRVDNEWGVVVASHHPTTRLRILKHGDSVPKELHSVSIDAFQSYLSGYVDHKNRIYLGPHEYLYFFDLDNASERAKYDFKDLVVHVSFQPTESP